MSDKLKQQLQQWLQEKLPGKTDLSISDFTSPQAGASNETLLFSIDYIENGQQQTRGLVARLEQGGEGIFPGYDLELQYTTMARLRDTPVKVPVMLGLEMDAAVLGKPFYIMKGWMVAIWPIIRLTRWRVG